MQQEVQRLTDRGVTFTQQPMDVGDHWVAVLDDTCGNLIQIVSSKQPQP